MYGHRCQLSPVRRGCPNRAGPPPLSNRWFWAYLPLIIMIFAYLRFDGYLLGNGVFHAADDLRGDTQFTRDADDVCRNGFRHIQLHAVPHVEYLIHLLPVGSRFFLDEVEQGRDVEQVVLDHMQVVDEVQYFGLCSATAMDHPMDLLAVIVEYPLDDRCIRPRGGEYQLPCSGGPMAGD